MPILRNGKIYPTTEENSQESVRSKNIATDGNTSGIHKKIQMHLMGTKPLTSIEIDKLVRILDKMDCPTPRERKYQNILFQIRNNTGPIADSQDTQASYIETLSSGPCAQEPINNAKDFLTDPSQASSIFSHTSHINDLTNTIKESGCQVTPPENESQESLFTVEQDDNVSPDSQASNVLKLRFNNVQSNEESLSFPLELLTNIDFVDTPMNCDSGLVNRIIENPLVSEASNLEICGQNKRTISFGEAVNDYTFNETLRDSPTQQSVCNNLDTQYGTGKEISCPSVQDTLKSKKDCNLECSKTKISKNIPFQNNLAGNIIYSTNSSLISVSSENIMSTSSTNWQDTFENTTWKKPDINCLLSRNIPSSIPKKKNMSSDYKYDLTRTPISNYREPFDLSEKTLWEIPKLKNNSAFISNIYSAASVKSQISEFELPSTGSTREEANVKISERTNYDLNHSNMLEIISVNSDKAIVEDNSIDDDCIITSCENQLQELPGGSSETDCVETTQNINIPTAEMEINKDVTENNKSFVFDLDNSESTITPIETAPFSSSERPITYKNNYIELPKKEQPKMIPFSQVSTINETADIVIDETPYVNTESTIFESCTSPYRYRTRTSRFLNYKSNGKSSRSVSSERRYSSKSGKGGPHCHVEDLTLDPGQVLSENILLINGVITKNHDQMDCSPSTTEEESFSEKRKKLVEHVLMKRNVYNAKWENMPVCDKISGKLADKFHVRIFEDPVESLINIGYKPNFNNFYFPRLTLKEMHEQLRPSWEITKMMDGVLTKVARDLVETNNTNAAFRMFRSSPDSDSELSSEEIEANNKWLKDYHKNTKYQMRKLMTDMYKERKNAELVSNGNREQYEPRKSEDSVDQLEDILKNMSNFDLIKE